MSTSAVQHVRGSLTLLKTRPRIRRRTATDVENELAGTSGHAVDDASKTKPGTASSRSDQFELPGPIGGKGLLHSDSQQQSSSSTTSALQRSRTPRETRLPIPVATNFEVEEEDDMADSNAISMRTCNSCGRHFNPLSFEKHAKVCAKVFVQKRKVFDSSGMRI